MTRLEWRGLTPEKREKKRLEKVEKAVAKEPKGIGFTDLYKKLGEHWSKRHFTRYLRILEDRYIITKMRIDKGEGVKRGKRRTRYVSTKRFFGSDYELFSRIRLADMREKKEFREVLNKVCKSKEKLSSEVAQASIYGVILIGLCEYLKGVEGVARTKEKFKSYARELLDAQTDRFGLLLVELGKKHPKEMEVVVKNFVKQLNASLPIKSEESETTRK